MKKILVGIVATVMGIFVALGLTMQPVMAECSQTQLDNGCVSTSILGTNGCSCDDGSGSGIVSILKLVVEIMTIGVGILGVIGITVVGIQYLTAGGNEEQTRKAKRRMFEIVLGLVAYVVLYALLNWLIPDFHPFA